MNTNEYQLFLEKINCAKEAQGGRKLVYALKGKRKKIQ